MSTPIHGSTPLDDDIEGVVVTDPDRLAELREQFVRTWGYEPPPSPDEVTPPEVARPA